ncbi:MAG: Lrp/AsnC family transcriptional regulator, partial [Vitreimonas sp.]
MVTDSSVNLDEFDHRILIELERDGVLTAAALSDRVGLSPSACHRRVKALEAAGVIEGYAAILSEKALGRSATIFVAVTLDNQRSETMAAFERAVAQCREVQDCHLMT